ncbi:MAG: glutathione S-transferase family protein [Hyphomicrobiales bacterium]|nr:glutathione S-transferase family protein [Hyphomicrobiales bacterium]
MMKLRYAKASPFVRKVIVFADEAGIADRIELQPADPWGNEADIAKDNPLGKVPALITSDGTFVGSFACCDYLDRRNGKRLIPDEPKLRWRAMQMHGLADGAMEATLVYVIESLRRPAEFVYQPYLDRQTAKIERALDAIEARLGDISEIDLGSITTGCMLGYLDFRMKGKLDWRKRAPGLAAWYADFSKRPSMLKTQPD